MRRILLTSEPTSFASTLDRIRMEDSTEPIISFLGILLGATAKSRPFDTTDDSSEKKRAHNIFITVLGFGVWASE